MMEKAVLLLGLLCVAAGVTGGPGKPKPIQTHAQDAEIAKSHTNRTTHNMTSLIQEHNEDNSGNDLKNAQRNSTDIGPYLDTSSWSSFFMSFLVIQEKFFFRFYQKLYLFLFAIFPSGLRFFVFLCIGIPMLSLMELWRMQIKRGKYKYCYCKCHKSNGEPFVNVHRSEDGGQRRRFI